MKDMDKTKEQLMNELDKMRGRITELASLETKRKQAEEKLRVASLYARNLIEASLDPLVTINQQGKITDVNKATETVTGASRERLIGTDFSSYFTESEKAKEGYQQVFSQGFVRDYPLTIRHVSGSTTDVLYNATVYRDKAGKVLGIFAAARDVTERKQAENMQFYISEITKAQEEERKRISQELHDDTAQSLARLGFDIDFLLRDKKYVSEEGVRHLEELRKRIDETLEGIRRFSQDLRPTILDELGLIEALQWLTDEIRNQQGINVSLELQGVSRRLSPEAELVLFRIAQEALNNVRKHSQATETVVRVEFTSEEVKLSISDNGQGFESLKEIGEFAHLGKLGLIGMQERAKLLNGTFEVQSMPGKGTTVAVSVSG